MGHGPPPEGREVDEGRFLAVLRDAIGALEDKDIPYLLMGGLSSATFGRPRGTNDIDVFVRPESARLTLEALASAGFTTEETDPLWLFKGFKDDILVDIIFRSTGDIYLDDEMLAHARIVDVQGCAARVIAPEDLLIIKALTADEHIPHHWHDALGVITGSELDWDYLVSRARRHGARRVLSLLLYAQSNDLGVPVKPVRALFDSIFET
ncbi:MAG: nucleotidyltransferase family protein [Actinomycetota bacterium]|nr:nucleotidyltransferase family protein [Actinomycetota bacterium]